DRVTDNDAPLGVDTDEGGVSATAEWKIGGTTLTSISAWRFWNWDAANDRDYTGLHIQTTQHIPSRQDQYSQEFRIGSNTPGKLEYVAGLYYFHQKITGRPISIYGPLATYWLLPASPTRTSALLDGYQTDGRTDFRSESMGVFGEVTWRPVERLALTGGIRYTYEEKDGVYDVRTFGGQATTPGSPLYLDQQSILRAQSYSAHDGDGSASGRVNVAYDLVDGVMAYASWAKGQKSGGINMSGLPVNAANQAVLTTAVVRPETNTTWEAGFKTRLLGGALVFNINAYHVDVTDFQANIVDNMATVALRSYLANIPKVRVKGIEFDASAAIGSRLTLRASGAYADGEYASYPSGPCPIERTGSSTARCDLTGNALPGLPKWTGSAGGEYRLPVKAGEMFLRADAVTRTRVLGEATGSAYTVIKGYTLVNGSVGYRMGRWEAAVFARNLFDRDFMQNLTVQAGNSGLIVGTPSEPRTIGVTVRMRLSE
ncbi:MAG TPA: TonB-dependent receptor, partial [Sphingobium sp.]